MHTRAAVGARKRLLGLCMSVTNFNDQVMRCLHQAGRVLYQVACVFHQVVCYLHQLKKEVGWKMRSAECGVWKMRSMESEEYGKCGVLLVSQLTLRGKLPQNHHGQSLPSHRAPLT